MKDYLKQSLIIIVVAVVCVVITYLVMKKDDATKELPPNGKEQQAMVPEPVKVPAPIALEQPPAPPAPAPTALEPPPVQIEPETPAVIPEKTEETFVLSPVTGPKRQRFNKDSLGVPMLLTQHVEKGNAKSAGLHMKAWDIDWPREVEFLVNGKKIHLPDQVFVNDQWRTVVAKVPLDTVKDGENVISVTFMDKKGTRGFTVRDVSLILSTEENHWASDYTYHQDQSPIQRFDEDGDGVVDDAELQRAAESVIDQSQQKGLTGRLATFDTNKDGQVAGDEHEAAVKWLIKSLREGGSIQ